MPRDDVILSPLTSAWSVQPDLPGALRATRTTDAKQSVLVAPVGEGEGGDGPLEVTKEGRGIVLRMPLEGGGRLVVEMTPDEVRALGDAITNCEGLK